MTKHIQPQSAEELYPIYTKALRAFEALTISNWDTEESKKIIEDFEKIAALYASAPFGNMKVHDLEMKIYELDIEAMVIAKNILEPVDTYEVRKMAEKILPRIIALLKATYCGAGALNARENSEVERKIHRPKTESAPTEIVKALESNGQSIADFYDSLTTFQALGADIPVIDGSIFWYAYTSHGSYDAYKEETLGYFATERAARLGIYDWMIKHTESVRGDTPWGKFDEIDDPDQWNKARFSWTENATFSEMVNWYSRSPDIDSVDFNIVKCVTSEKPIVVREPKDLMDVSLE